MTIDEAIEHAKEVARTCDDSQCAADHIQLAEWLRQARGADKAERWYTAKIRELENKNAKLRERYYAYEYKMDGLVCKLTGGLLSKSATLSNDALYSVVEEQMTDELVDENFKLGLENSKLRELARGLNWCTENAKVPSAECEHCPLGDTFYECGELSCEKLMRELGIEVES